MKRFWGKEEKRLEQIKPKVEIPPELQKKQRIDKSRKKILIILLEKVRTKKG